MKFANFIPHSLKTTEIKIVSYENKVPCGYLISQFYVENMSFIGLFEALALIENIQDGIGFPQKTTDCRTFSEAKPDEKRCTTQFDDRKVIAVFRITILFRQNATWQGTILWVDKDESASFRSVWELVKLMDSALTQ